MTNQINSYIILIDYFLIFIKIRMGEKIEGKKIDDVIQESLLKQKEKPTEEIVTVFLSENLNSDSSEELIEWLHIHSTDLQEWVMLNEFDDIDDRNELI